MSLEKSEILNILDASQIKSIIESVKIKSYNSGDVVVEDLTQNGGLFIIVKGEL